MDERKVVAASLIVDFYNNVSQLNHTFCIYKNYLVELKVKSLDKLEENQKNVLMTTVQNFRYYANKSYLQYLTLNKEGIIKEKTELKKQYESINHPNNFIIETDQAEKFLTEIMALFVQGVVKDLLTTSQQIFKDIYGTNSTETEKRED